MKSIKKWFKENKNLPSTEPCFSKTQNKKIIKFTLIAFVIWQIAVAVIIALGVKYFPTTNQYLYFERSEKQGSPYTEKQMINPPGLWNRANFDGINYLDIAKKGYGIYQQAFFPLYPKLIAWLTPLFGGRNLVAAWTINLVCFYLALFFFYKLVALDFSEKVSKRTLLYLLIFPTAFFFSMVYTESLFFFLIIASFYFARTKKWWLAGIFGGLASATRLPGIFLFPALLFEWWQQRATRDQRLVISNQKKPNPNCQSLVTLIPILFIPLGLLWYMRFLAINFGDSLMFIHVQKFFGAGRSADRIILLYQVFWRYFKMLVTVEKNTLTYFAVVMEFLAAASFLILIIFTYLKRWYSYLIFMVLAYIAPTLTGTFLSLPRFVLVLFPGFILLSLWAEKYRWVKIIYPFLTIPLLILCLLLFTRGYWTI
jgi:hypothetical protein